MSLTPEILAVFSPLAGFLLAFLLGKKIGDKGAQLVTCAGLLIAAAASVYLFLDVVLNNNPHTITLMNWITAGDFSVNWALKIDQLSVVMMCVINIVSACVHIYSVGYMSHDEHQARFMSYLSLFTFAMLMLVTSDNLLQLFFGWEGVGVASYLLIGFWNKKDSANAAAVKAFLVNRVGDFGLALGVMATFVVFGSISFETIFAAAPDKAAEMFSFLGYQVHALTLVCLLLFIGACGKSAQLGLHTWLPDAMEGPTPVSALIHAATMVTAGVFLVARFSPVFEYAPIALQVVCVVGALTAFVAATIGMTQFDIKRVIAYSTMSQLGYMFFALGVSAYGAAMFHLVTHAFFKALLFLGAGSVIHAMSGEQDMRRMGGIWKAIPVTYTLMWIGSLALAGIPFFSGFYSKDMILEAAFADHSAWGTFAFWMGVAAAFMTAFYTWRLLIMSFHGKPNADKETMDHVHESPPVMLVPLFVLAFGALFAGGVFYKGFVGSAHEVVAAEGAHHAATFDPMHPEELLHLPKNLSDKESFWNGAIKVLPENDTVVAAHHVPKWVKLSPLVVGVAGILLAYIVYLVTGGAIARAVVRIFAPLHTLFFRKWFFDELYNVVFVKNALRLGRVFAKGDRKVIDGLGPDGIAAASTGVGAILRRFQSGFVYQYAFVMMIGLFGLVTWFFVKFMMQ